MRLISEIEPSDTIYYSPSGRACYHEPYSVESCLTPCQQHTLRNDGYIEIPRYHTGFDNRLERTDFTYESYVYSIQRKKRPLQQEKPSRRIFEDDDWDKPLYSNDMIASISEFDIMSSTDIEVMDIDELENFIESNEDKKRYADKVECAKQQLVLLKKEEKEDKKTACKAMNEFSDIADEQMCQRIGAMIFKLLQEERKKRRMDEYNKRCKKFFSVRDIKQYNNF